jgi:hypothetical protein
MNNEGDSLQKLADGTVTVENGLGTAELVPLTKGVSLHGKMGADGYIPKNDGWFERLTKIDDEIGPTDHNGQPRRIGRDPMSIPVDVLTASGHPRRRTSKRLSLTSLKTTPWSNTRTFDAIASIVPRAWQRFAVAR